MIRLTCLGLSFISSVALASGTVRPSSTLTMGPSTDPHSVFAAEHNPAVGDLVLGVDENWRMNYLPAFSFSVELGQVDNFADDLDELIDILDDPSIAEDSADETLKRFNTILESMGEEGYLKSNLSVYLPIMPLHWRSDLIKGTLSTSISFATQIRLGVLDGPLSYDNQNGSFSTATSAYIKSAIEKTLSIGYSRPLLSEGQMDQWGGQLYAGVKANFISLELSKQIFHLQALDGEGIEDVVEDEYENNLNSTTNLGIDVGVLWRAKRYQAGVTLKNLNQPTFDYGALGGDGDCTNKAEGSVERTNCDVANEFILVQGELRGRETHEKSTLFTVDGLFKIMSWWYVSGTLDLAAYDDYVGDQNQWLTLSTAMYPKSGFIPDLRAGYKQNMAGSELSSMTFGATFFKRLTFDIEIGLESIEVDGSSGPRSFGFALGLQEKF